MNKKSNFNLVMISAMYENGGNTTHRFLDSHPQLYTYPFETQLGTPFVNDHLASLFPLKYRWPEFPLSGNFDDDYELIIDEELKRHIKTPLSSKFKNADMNLDDKDRKKIFLSLLKNKSRTRANIISAFFMSTFTAWKNYNSSGKECAYLGYSPIVGVDAEKIFNDFPTAHIIHVVRNPYSAYADTKKRPVPYSITRYMQIWNIMQHMALTFTQIYPKNFHLVKFEDLLENPKNFFTKLLNEIGLTYISSLEYPSWNGRKLEQLIPWGTIKIPTKKANLETAKELSQKDYKEIKKLTSVLSKILGYDQF